MANIEILTRAKQMSKLDLMIVIYSGLLLLVPYGLITDHGELVNLVMVINSSKVILFFGILLLLESIINRVGKRRKLGYGY